MTFPQRSTLEEADRLLEAQETALINLGIVANEANTEVNASLPPTEATPPPRPVTIQTGEVTPEPTQTKKQARTNDKKKPEPKPKTNIFATLMND